MRVLIFLMFSLVTSLAMATANPNVFIQNRDLSLNQQGKLTVFPGDIDASNASSTSYTWNESNPAYATAYSRSTKYRLEIYKNKGQITRIVEGDKSSSATVSFVNNELKSYTKCANEKERLAYVFKTEHLSCVTVSPKICKTLSSFQDKIDQLKKDAKVCRDVMSSTLSLKQSLKGVQDRANEEKLVFNDAIFLVDNFDKLSDRSVLAMRETELKAKVAVKMDLPESPFALVETIQDMAQMCETAKDYLPSASSGSVTGVKPAKAIK